MTDNTFLQLSLCLCLTLISTQFGCDLFTEITSPDGVIDNTNNTTKYTPTCANAGCSVEGLYRCKASSYERCDRDTALACTLFKPQVDCAQVPSLDKLLSVDTMSMATVSSKPQMSDKGLWISRGNKVIFLDNENPTKPEEIDAGQPLSNLHVDGETIYVSDVDGLVYTIGQTEALTLVLSPAKTIKGPALFATGQRTYVAHGDTIQTTDSAWNQTIQTSAAPDAIAVGLEGTLEKVFVASGNKLYKLDGTTGKVESSASLPSTAIGMVAENGGVWVAYQKSLIRYEGINLDMASVEEKDILCGTASSLSLYDGALWITDIGGCLSKYDLTSNQLATTTIDINNRSGAPTTTNYRPHAPSFGRGQGYIVAKTTEVVIFDPQTMNETNRRTLTGFAKPLSQTFVWQDNLVVSDERALTIFSENCPCP